MNRDLVINGRHSALTTGFFESDKIFKDPICLLKALTKDQVPLQIRHILLYSKKKKLVRVSWKLWSFHVKLTPPSPICFTLTLISSNSTQLLLRFRNWTVPPTFGKNLKFQRQISPKLLVGFRWNLKCERFYVQLICILNLKQISDGSVRTVGWSAVEWPACFIDSGQ